MLIRRKQILNKLAHSSAYIAVIILFLITISPVYAQVEHPNFNEEEKDWISEQDTVYFGYDPNWMPYEFIDNHGQHDGIIEQLLELVRENTDLNIQPYPNLTWPTSVEALEEERIQFLPGLGITEDRKLTMSFTSSYMSFPFVIINSKDGGFIGTLDDLKGHTMALPEGYMVTEKVETDFPDVNILYTKDFEEALLLILTNKADATIEALPVASYYLNYKGFDNLQIATAIEGYNMEMNMAVKKGNDTLLNILDKALNQISEGEKQKIINNWVTVKFEHGVDMTRVWKIAGICALAIGIILSIILIWNRTLKKEILMRKEAEEKLQASFKEIHLQKDLVEEKNKEIIDSINYAYRIQNAILPPDRFVKEYLPNSFVLYKPKDIVAGDFYWMEHIDDKIIFAAADCTGHGVPGAMLSMLCNNALNRSVREYGLTDPGKILDKTREIIIGEFEKSDENVKDGMDISLCVLSDKKLLFAGAYNHMWIIRGGEVIELKADRQPIGNSDNPVPFTTSSFDLEEGDTFYIFSDGYVDQFGGVKGKKLKTKAFRELLLKGIDKPMKEQSELLDAAIENWRGDLEQVDDICVIGVKV